MIISRENEYVYLDVPKAGSSTMRSVLPERFEGQFVGSGMNVVPDYVKKSWTVFSIVRHPFERAVSLWWRTCVDNKDDRYSVSRNSGASGENSFSRFVEWLCSWSYNDFGIRHRSEGRHEMFLPQFYWIDKRRPPCKVQTLSLENIDEEFSELDFVDQEILLPVANKSSGRPGVEEVIDERTNELLFAFYIKDFLCFGYDNDNDKLKL